MKFLSPGVLSIKKSSAVLWGVLTLLVTVPSLAQDAVTAPASNGVKLFVIAGLCDSKIPNVLTTGDTSVRVSNADMRPQAFKTVLPSAEKGTSLELQVSSYQVYPGHEIYKIRAQLIRKGKKDVSLDLSVPQRLSASPDTFPYQASVGSSCNDASDDGRPFILVNAGLLKD